MLLLRVASVRVQNAAADAGGASASEPEPVLQAPRLIEFVEAEYPPGAEIDGQEASVELEITVDTEGAVTDVRVVKGVGPAFDEAATRAARQFRFEPAQREGVRVPARIGYRYVFELKTPADEARSGEAARQPAPGKLQGTVRGADGRIVRTAEVILSNPATGAALRTTTDSDGRFDFAPLDQGDYAIAIRAAGFRVVEETLHVGVAQEVTVRYQLQRQVERDPEAFGATALIDPPARELTRRTISREVLTRVSGTRGDALRAVELLPGVARPPFGLGVLLVRGSAPGDSEVFLDGVSVPLLYHFGGITSFYNSYLLDRIDFYPGNFSARFGRRTGGILEVDARDPAGDQLRGLVNINLIDASFVVEGPITDELSVSLAARRSYIDFFLENLIPEDAFNILAAPVYYDYQLTAVWKPHPLHRFRLLVYGSGDVFRVLFAEPADQDPAFRGNVDLSTEFHRFQLSWRAQPEPWLDQDITLAGGLTYLNFAAGNALKFDADFVPLYVRSEWRARLAPSLRLIWGIDIQFTPFKLFFRGNTLTGSEGTPDAGDPLGPNPDVELNSRGQAYRPAAYVEVDVRPWDKLQLVWGLRLDWFGEIQEWSFDPRVSARWSVLEQTALKAAIGWFSQPPEFQESAEVIGNPALEVLHALHLGLGVDHRFDEVFSVSVDGFYKHIYNRVVGTGSGNAPFFTNDGIGRIYGAEVAARAEPIGRFFGFLSYTLSRSERLDREGAWRLFDFDQTHILTLSGVYRLGDGWEAGATFRLVTGNPFTPVVGGVFNANAGVYQPVYGAANGERNPLFHRLDVRLEKQWRVGPGTLAVFIDVQNVYNAMNREGVTYNFDFSQRGQISGLPIIPSLGVRGQL